MDHLAHVQCNSSAYILSSDFMKGMMLLKHEIQIPVRVVRYPDERSNLGEVCRNRTNRNRSRNWMPEPDAGLEAAAAADAVATAVDTFIVSR